MKPFKTGAAGAVGIDALAREDASTMGVIGAGKQARGQIIHAVTVRDLDEILIYSPTPENREGLASDLDEHLSPAVRAVGSASDAVVPADIVVTATTAREPVFDSEDLQPGTHVTAMGQYDPAARELEAETVARATYVPDLHDRAFSDAGSFLHALEAGAITEDHVHAELGEIVAGNAAGRTDPDEITIFDSGGTAIETVAAGAMLYERAVEDDRGTELQLRPASEV